MHAVEGFGLRPQGFDEIVWRFIPEPSTAVAEVITGNVDIYKEFPANQADAISNSGMAEARFFAGTTRTYIGFNLNPDAPFRVNTPSLGADAIMNECARGPAIRIDTDATAKFAAAPASAPPAWSMRPTITRRLSPIPMTRPRPRNCWTRPAIRAVMMACVSRWR